MTLLFHWFQNGTCAAFCLEWGNANTRLGWARRPWPTWRRSVRQVRLSVDVGLEFLVLLFQDKRTERAAATDARPVVGTTWLLCHGRKRKKSPFCCGFTEKLYFCSKNKSDHGRSKRKGGTVKLGQILLASCTSYCPKAMTTLLQGFVTGRRQICKQIRRVNCCLAFALNRTHSNCIDER